MQIPQLGEPLFTPLSHALVCQQAVVGEKEVALENGL